MILMHLRKLQPHVWTKNSIFPITAFYLCLLTWDFVIGTCSTFNIHWIYHGEVRDGKLCVAQGVLRSCGPRSLILDTCQAFCEQLSDTGATMAIVAMCYCILYDHVFQVRRRFGNRDIIFGILVMSVIQVIDIAVPNIIVGPHNYYGVDGLVHPHEFGM
jgi:hypothetical protein